MWRNTEHSYGFVSRFLHWLIFLLLLGMIIYGFVLPYLPDSYQGTAYNIHKLTGLSILILMLIRLIWKWGNPTPLLPTDTPPWQLMIDRIVQWLLYITVIAMPIAGWVGTSASDKPPHLGHLALRLPVASSKALAELAFTIHNTLAIIIIVLVSIHILAALYHYFVKKDRVLQRMLTGVDG